MLRFLIYVLFERAAHNLLGFRSPAVLAAFPSQMLVLLGQSLPLEVKGDLSKLVQRRLEIFRNFCGNHIGSRQIRRILQAFILQPENVQTNLVSL
jgi:hypothetical protein